MLYLMQLLSNGHHITFCFLPHKKLVISCGMFGCFCMAFTSQDHSHIIHLPVATRIHPQGEGPRMPLVCVSWSPVILCQHIQHGA